MLATLCRIACMSFKSSGYASKIGENSVSPKALSPKDAASYLGISRGLLYEYLDINGGPIKSAHLKRRGHTRGRRLVYRDSLDAFLRQLESSTANTPSGGSEQGTARREREEATH